MCGHGIIAMTKLLVESGFPADSDVANNRAELRIDTPAGLVTAHAHFAPVSLFSLTRPRSTAAKHSSAAPRPNRTVARWSA
jgi:proline racemase